MKYCSNAVVFYIVQMPKITVDDKSPSQDIPKKVDIYFCAQHVFHFQKHIIFFAQYRTQNFMSVGSMQATFR